MATRSAKPAEVPEAVAYFPSTAERRGLAPHEVKRPRWKPRQTVRSVGAGHTSTEDVVRVWLEHRARPGLAFGLELDGAGQLVAFTVRPLAFIGTDMGDGGIPDGTDIDEEHLPAGAPRITATLMRDVPLGALHSAAVESAARLRAVGVKGAPTVRARYRSDATPDEDVAAFAGAYLEACQRGLRGPLKATAERFGYSEGGGRERLRSARSRGIYVGLGQGKAGGHLTAKGRAILEGA